MSLPVADDSREVFGRYRLVERIGAGGMAFVYRALAQAPDGSSRELVIKRVLPELSRDRQFSSMLVAEARICARLNHPNIVQVYEFGRVGDEFYLAMELVDGVDLVRLLNRCNQAKRQVPVALACQIVVQLASALAYAHDLRDNEGRPLSIVHRDVTPSNVMVTRQGGVKLLDFGVAKAADHISDDRTRTGTLKGKVNYLSPEGAEGLRVDRRADIFALGVVLHECLSLKRLFKADGDLQTLRLIREAKVVPPSTLRAEVPPELDRVVLKMLARDPEARYADCRQIVDDLTPITRQLGGEEGGLARLVLELLAEPEPAASDEEPAASDDDMDSGPTPSMQIENMLARPLAAATPMRPRWLWPVLVSAATLPALAIALLVGHHTESKAAPPAPVVIAAPVVVAPPPPVEAPGLLVVETNVADARITLDGQVVADQVPRARIPVTRSGEHELSITAARRRPFDRKLTIAAGATIEMRVKLQRNSRPSKPTRSENYLVNPFGK